MCHFGDKPRNFGTICMGLLSEALPLQCLPVLFRSLQFPFLCSSQKSGAFANPFNHVFWELGSRKTERKSDGSLSHLFRTIASPTREGGPPPSEFLGICGPLLALTTSTNTTGITQRLGHEGMERNLLKGGVSTSLSLGVRNFFSHSSQNQRAYPGALSFYSWCLLPGLCCTESRPGQRTLEIKRETPSWMMVL